MECSIYTTVAKVGISKKRLETVVHAILRYCKQPKAVLSVHLIGDKRMRTLNRHYRGIDKTTDVLSFSVREGFQLQDQTDLGDLFLSVPQIQKQARQYNITYTEELFRMLSHGVLHLLGHDHVTQKEAKEMFELQEDILSRLLKRKATPMHHRFFSN